MQGNIMVWYLNCHNLGEKQKFYKRKILQKHVADTSNKPSSGMMLLSTRPVVAFPASQLHHHRPVAIYCLVNSSIHV